MFKQSDNKYLHFSWCLLHKLESRKNKLLTGQPLRWKLSFWRFFLDFIVSFLKKSNVLSFKWNQLFFSQCFSIYIHSILSNIQIVNVHQLMTRVTSHFITFQYVCFVKMTNILVDSIFRSHSRFSGPFRSSQTWKDQTPLTWKDGLIQTEIIDKKDVIGIYFSLESVD